MPCNMLHAFEVLVGDRVVGVGGVDRHGNNGRARRQRRPRCAWHVPLYWIGGAVSSTQHDPCAMGLGQPLAPTQLWASAFAHPCLRAMPSNNRLPAATPLQPPKGPGKARRPPPEAPALAPQVPLSWRSPCATPRPHGQTAGHSGAVRHATPRSNVAPAIMGACACMHLICSCMGIENSQQLAGTTLP